jgi:ketosteroid isomerase-like protein
MYCLFIIGIINKKGEVMKLVYMLPVFFVLFTVTGCTQSGSEIDLKAEAETIREISAAFFAAELNRDLDGFVSFLAPDAIIQAGDVSTMDKAGLRAYTAEFFKLPYTDIPLTEPRLIEVARAGDVAYDIGPWKVVLDGGSELYGKSTIIWRKLNDEWKVVLMSFSMDAPAAAN